MCLRFLALGEFGVAGYEAVEVSAGPCFVRLAASSVRRSTGLSGCVGLVKLSCGWLMWNMGEVYV